MIMKPIKKEPQNITNNQKKYIYVYKGERIVAEIRYDSTELDGLSKEEIIAKVKERHGGDRFEFVEKEDELHILSESEYIKEKRENERLLKELEIKNKKKKKFLNDLAKVCNKHKMVIWSCDDLEIASTDDMSVVDMLEELGYYEL